MSKETTPTEMQTRALESENAMKLSTMLAGESIGVGRPAERNPVPTMIANQLPAIPNNQNYTRAKQDYKRLGESARIELQRIKIATEAIGRQLRTVLAQS